MDTLIKMSMLLLLFECQVAPAQKTQLYLGGLFELSEYWFSPYAAGIIEIIKMAIEDVATLSDLLPKYDLKLISKDTKAKPGLAAKKLFELISEDPPKLAIIGPQLSPELVLVGEIPQFYDLLQLNFVAGTSTIKDRNLYSNLYSTSYILDDLNPLRIQMMKYFSWTRVATVVFDSDFFGSLVNDFHESLEAEGYTLITSSVIVDVSSISENIERLKQYNSRIIFAAFRSTMAPAIFCEVYRQGLFGQKYVWILPGSSMYTGWEKSFDASTISCTREQVQEAANGYITIDFKHLPPGMKDTVTVSGQKQPEVVERMENLTDSLGYRLSKSAPFVYDGIWALAMGLNYSHRYLNGSSLEDYKLNNSNVIQAIKMGMDDVQFTGISGPVSFIDGRRRGFYYIERNIDFDRVEVAYFNPNTQELLWIENSLSLFGGNSVPRDVFTYKEVYGAYSPSAFVVVILFNTCGLALGVAFLVFNIYFRKNTNIKMSSPRINNLIICGSFVVFGCVYFNAYDFYKNQGPEKFDDCMILTWLYCVGFTVLFGSLFSKTWRVHMLFRQENLRKMSIKDYQLFVLVGILLCIDIVILSLWTIIHPSVQTYEKFMKTVPDLDVVMTEVYVTCNHQYHMYWMAVEYIYKGLLLAFGAFLAWETRQITVPALNDSKLIGFCVYNVFIVSTMVVTLQFALKIEQAMLKFLLINILIVFCTAMVLCILFIPKISLRNKTESVKFVPGLNSSSHTNANTTTMVCLTPPLNFTRATENGDEITTPMNNGLENGKGNNCLTLQRELLEERRSIQKLQDKLLAETGNLYFHKVGSEYVLYRKEKANLQQNKEESLAFVSFAEHSNA